MTNHKLGQSDLVYWYSIGRLAYTAVLPGSAS